MTQYRVGYIDEHGHHYEDEITAPSWQLAKLAVEEAGGVILELEEVLREMAHETAIRKDVQAA